MFACVVSATQRSIRLSGRRSRLVLQNEFSATHPTNNKFPSQVLQPSHQAHTLTALAPLRHRHWRYVFGLATAVTCTTAVGMSTLVEAAPTTTTTTNNQSSSSTTPAAVSTTRQGTVNSSKIVPTDPAKGIKDEGIHLEKLLKPSTGKPLIVLIACGSYSPITNMHLLVFEQARNYLQFEQNRYDVIGGFLSPVHDAYGKASLIAQQHRFEMCQAAVQNSVWLSVQEWEMKQKGWTTTAETLCKYQEALNRAHLTEEPIRVKMLCGADLLESTLVPNLWSKEDLDLIFGTFGVAVIERVGLDLSSLIDSNETLSRYRSNIDIVPQRITNTISSTSVRNLIKSQQSIRYLTPDAVIQYIYRHQLYGHDALKHPAKPEYLIPKI